MLCSALAPLLLALCSTWLAVKLTTNRSTRIPRIDPNPVYSFLLMVMCNRLSIRSMLLQGPRAGTAGLLVDDFNDFHGLFGCFFVLPFFYGVASFLSQHGASAHNARITHLAIRRYGRFKPYGASDMHLPSNVRIDRLDRSFHLAAAMVLDFARRPILRK